MPKFEATLSSLQEWLACVPPHLSSGAPTAPTAPMHRRPIALLHVRYWSVIILVTRPFLLCSILRSKQLQECFKLAQFERLGNICVEAAVQSHSILQSMAKDRLLSSAEVSDFHFLLELLQVFLLAYMLQKLEGSQDRVRSCMEMLQSLGSAGYCKRLLPEVLNQIKSSGIFRVSNEGSENLQLSDTSSMDGQPGSEYYDMYYSQLLDKVHSQTYLMPP